MLPHTGVCSGRCVQTEPLGVSLSGPWHALRLRDRIVAPFAEVSDFLSKVWPWCCKIDMEVMSGIYSFFFLAGSVAKPRTEQSWLPAPSLLPLSSGP